jgi:hypothetical protein
MGVPAGIRGSTRCTHSSTERVGKRLDHAKTFRPTHASTTRDNNRCLGELRARSLGCGRAAGDLRTAGSVRDGHLHVDS